MKTHELLRVLARENETEAKPSSSWTVSRAMTYWSFGALLILSLSIWLLPVREDLHDRLHQLDFFFLNFLFAALTFSSVRLAILSSFPEENIFRRKELYLLFSLFGALAAWMIFRVPTQNVAFEFYRERNPVNGGCGMVILVSGLLHSGLALHFFRRGASTQPKTTGSLLALSTGAFSMFLIQFACANEHPFHVFMWHILPLMGLTYGLSVITPRVLRW